MENKLLEYRPIREGQTSTAKVVHVIHPRTNKYVEMVQKSREAPAQQLKGPLAQCGLKGVQSLGVEHRQRIRWHLMGPTASLGRV